MTTFIERWGIRAASLVSQPFIFFLSHLQWKMKKQSADDLIEIRRLNITFDQLKPYFANETFKDLKTPASFVWRLVEYNPTENTTEYYNTTLRTYWRLEAINKFIDEFTSPNGFNREQMIKKFDIFYGYPHDVSALMFLQEHPFMCFLMQLMMLLLFVFFIWALWNCVNGYIDDPNLLNDQATHFRT